MTTSLEKMLFIDIISKQQGKLPSENPDYYSTWNLLNKDDKMEYGKLSNLIHNYWNYINMPHNIPLTKPRVDSIFMFNSEIDPVEKRILKVCTDFNLTLKNEPLSEKSIILIKKLLGTDKFNELFG